MGLTWAQQNQALWDGFERRPGERAMTWRASVAFRSRCWRVTTAKGEMTTAFLTAEDAMAATDEAFDRATDRTIPT